MYTVTGLFSGIGGIELAFAWAGFDVRYMVENNAWCQDKLRYNLPKYWPNAEVYGDVKEVSAAQLKPTDVICGGFPCQDVSLAGKRKGITEDSQSGLWIEYARLISELRPRLALLENVSGICTKDGVRVAADLTALGYDSEWGIIPAQAVGTPHERERWFCVAYPHTEGRRDDQRIQIAGKDGTERRYARFSGLKHIRANPEQTAANGFMPKAAVLF